METSSKELTEHLGKNNEQQSVLLTDLSKLSNEQKIDYGKFQEFLEGMQIQYNQNLTILMQRLDLSEQSLTDLERQLTQEKQEREALQGTIKSLVTLLKPYRKR